MRIRKLSENDYVNLKNRNEYAVTSPDQKDELANPGTVCLAALARLQILQNKMWTRDGRRVELDYEDQREYDRLMDWWAHFQGKQLRLLDLAKEVAANVEEWAVHF